MDGRNNCAVTPDRFAAIPYIIYGLLMVLGLSCERREFIPRARVIPGQASEVMATRLVISAEIIDLGTGVREHGVCWGPVPGPTIVDSRLDLGPVKETGQFTVQVPGLQAGKAYHFRAFLIGDEVYYSEEILVTTQDGKCEISVSAVEDIRAATARVRAEVHTVRGDEVLERGVCWDTIQEFSLGNCLGFTFDSAGLGTFDALLTGLSPGERYHVRAYARSGVDTSYSEPLIFSSMDGIPELTTGQPDYVTASAVTSGGRISSDGGAGIASKGVCWSTSAGPTIMDSSRADTASGGQFTLRVTGLDKKTTYYMRAFATTAYGTGYGNQVSFTTRNGIPVLYTLDVKDITAASAATGGNIPSDGGTTISKRGVCWNTTGNPTTADEKTEQGSGPGSFQSDLNGLLPNTTYYVRVYAITEFGPGYGYEISFLTKGLPELLTRGVDNVTESAATGGGNVTEDWDFPVTQRGICWNTTGSPTLEDQEGYTEDGGGTGMFTSNLTGLDYDTRYYVRAYATNSIGTSYGREQVFETLFGCGKNTVKDYDGNIYPTIQIGDQCWMNGNLKVTRYPDGSPIPRVNDATVWDEMEYNESAFCYYNNNPAMGNDYGALYTWNAVMNDVPAGSESPSGIQGICPAGWHVPSDEEWKELEMHLGMSRAEADASGNRGTDQGGRLKEAWYDHWSHPNIGATNESGFSVLPAGKRDDEGNFRQLTFFGYFWTTTDYSFNYAWSRSFSYTKSQVSREAHYKGDAISVRCILDGR